jgi:hypothetical protein
MMNFANHKPMIENIQTLLEEYKALNQARVMNGHDGECKKARHIFQAIKSESQRLRDTTLQMMKARRGYDPEKLKAMKRQELDEAKRIKKPIEYNPTQGNDHPYLDELYG